MNASTAKQDMINSTLLLLRERGLTGTSVRDVVAHSGAPRGSVYHHFPGGKEQMVSEALAAGNQYIVAALDRYREDGAPVEALRAFVAGWRELLIASDFRAGCPVAAVAAEAPEEGVPASLGDSAAAIFNGWQAVLTDAMVKRGVDAERAAGLATLMIASTEGAILLCRAQRSTAPIEAVGAQLEPLIEQALA